MGHSVLASITAEEPAGSLLVCWQPLGAAVGPARLGVCYLQFSVFIYMPPKQQERVGVKQKSK